MAMHIVEMDTTAPLDPGDHHIIPLAPRIPRRTATKYHQVIMDITPVRTDNNTKMGFIGPYNSSRRT